MADLFDGEMTGMGPNAAAARIGAMAADAGTAPDLATAARVLVDDRERLLAVASLAKRVRAAQKRYFADRTNEALTASKELERKLDAMLKD